MAPILEFEPFLIDRARNLIAWTEGQKTNDQVEHINRGHDVDVVFYKDRRQPTIIHHKVSKAFEKWGGHRIYGEQKVLDDIQESIGERGVIFDSKKRRKSTATKPSGIAHRPRKPRLIMSLPPA